MFQCSVRSYMNIFYLENGRADNILKNKNNNNNNSVVFIFG